MMEGLPTCANCHSFSRDGKWMGIDVDGPQNDKGLYALVPVRKETSIRNDYVIRWNSFSDDPAKKRFGFMSQISPDGQYLITSTEPPDAHMKQHGRAALQRVLQGLRLRAGVLPDARHSVLVQQGDRQAAAAARRRRPRAWSRPARSGARTASTWCSPAPRRAILIRRARRSRSTPTRPTRRRSNTTCTGSRSTTARAASPSRCGAPATTG